jgi:NAD(P)-dependent dehydrogenase (short-subunit alcohol dehydrogenase family)
MIPSGRGRVVVITGSSSGFGRAAAERFGSRGWQVFAAVRLPASAEPLRILARERDWRLETPTLDVTDEGSVASAMSEILRATDGRVDVLVNNAGYYAYGALEDTTSDELRAVLETNVVGVHRVTRAVLPAMRARGSGTVITLGSISGKIAIPLVGPYHASKWALEGMIEAWRLELYPFGVRVVLIEPGAFATRLHDNERPAVAITRGGAYAGMLAEYRRQTAALRRAANLGPVVDAIERAATAADPPLRWPVGPGAFSAGRLRPFVPDRVYEWIMRRAFRMRRIGPPDTGRTDASLQL